MNNSSSLNSTLSSSLHLNETDIRLGWTEASNDRGTLDILWSCFLTLFLCCWSVLIPNVPEKGQPNWASHLMFRKFLLCGLCILAPEILLLAALGQFIRAKKAKEAFRNSGHTDWTLRHSFYVNMGGIHLKTLDYPKGFPIDAVQLHELIKKGYIDYTLLPDIDRIRDKNKVDGLLRVITILQTLWFIANIIGRAWQNLAITALELSTSAYVMMSVVVFLFWIQKPADIQTFEDLPMDARISDFLKNEGRDPDEDYSYTPLDYLSRNEWSWSIMWAHGLFYLRTLNLARQPMSKPVNRFQNTIIPPIEGLYYYVYVTITLAYFGLFALGWNFDFPTEIEKNMWRVSSLTVVTTVFIYMFLMKCFFDWKLAIKRTLGLSEAKVEEESPRFGIRRRKSILKRIIPFLRRHMLLDDPQLRAPLGAIFATWILGFIYCSARTYIAVADIIELRSLPPSAYQTVEWTEFLPHF